MNSESIGELVVVKRSGQRVFFNGLKIAIAIKNAFDSVYSNPNEKEVNKVYEDVLKYIELNYKGRKTIQVEDIQDIIEEELKNNKYSKVYESFSAYRKKRAESRKAFAVKQQHKFVKAIEKIANDNNSQNDSYLKPKDTLLKFGKTVSTEYTKSYVLDNKFIRAHEEGSIYIHNLDYYALGSFSKAHLKVNDLNFNSEIDDITSSNYELSEEISIPRIDYISEKLLLDYFKNIFKNKLNGYLRVGGILEYINIKKLEETIDELNDLKYGGLEPYILNEQAKNIFEMAYQDALKESKDYLSKAIEKLLLKLNVKGKYSFSLGTNKSKAGEIIIEEIIEVIGKLKPLVNVLAIFKINKKYEEDYVETVSKLIMESKNVALSFVDSNLNKGLNEIEYFSNGDRIYENITSFESSSVGRIKIASTSINMARLGIKYRNKKKEFYKELDETLELIKNELLSTFEYLGDKYKENYQLLFEGNILDDEKFDGNQKIRKVIKNGTLDIGIVGLKECVIALNGSFDEKLRLEILKYIKNYSEKITNENKLNFVVSETSDKQVLKELMTIDKTIYGINKDITDHEEYYILGNEELEISKLKEYEKIYNGGMLSTLVVNKNIKKITEIIKELIDCDIGFAYLTLERRRL